MPRQAITAFVACVGLIAALNWATRYHPLGTMAAQLQSRSVTVERLATTPPLPFALEPTTATLERIVIAPGADSETTFAGPVLLYVEEGTLHVDWDRHRLAIVQTGDQAAIRGEQRIRKGTIPAGFGVYSADGNPGPLANSGEMNLRLLAVLFVPQPNDEGDAITMSATAGPSAATPTP